MKHFFLLISIMSTNLIAQVDNNQLAAELEDFIQTQMLQNNIPGLSACIVKENQVVWKTALGTANFDTQAPVTTETLFTLASISKLFTATACAQIAERGILDLDTDINDYLPIEIINPNFPNTPITTRQLLQHKSSLKDFESDLQLWDAIGDPIYDLPTFCAQYFVQGGDLFDTANFAETAPGNSPYWYSNAGFTLLGYIVESASGMPFNEYCRSNILEPLEMPTAGWFYATIDTMQLAMPYQYVNGNYEPYGYFSVPEYPAAMLKSNVEELAHFLMAYTQHGLFEDDILFNKNTFENLVPESMTGGFGWWGKDTWYGDSAGNYWSHGGFMNGVRTQLNYYPSDSTGLILLTNGEGNYTSIQNKIESYIPLFQVETTSINDVDNFEYEIISNPIIGKKLELKLNDSTPKLLKICDLQGRTLKDLEIKKKELTINLSDFPSGIYLLQLSQGRQLISKKIVIP